MPDFLRMFKDVSYPGNSLEFENIQHALFPFICHNPASCENKAYIDTKSAGKNPCCFLQFRHVLVHEIYVSGRQEQRQIYG